MKLVIYNSELRFFDMGYWKTKPPLIWNNSDLVLFQNDRFRVIDGGASGELFEPFDAISEFCDVITFEPRGNDTVQYAARINIDAGLWREPSHLKLSVATDPSTSSIYPPNMSYLKRFPAKFGVDSRRTAKIVEVPLTSIDAEVAKGTIPKPNFVKLDIHSAEYEAVVGSLASLDECLGILVETWHAPIHLGQHLNGEVEALLQSNGFQLYDTKQNSASNMFNKLVRTFAMQIETLKRYRSSGEQKVTVNHQHVSVTAQQAVVGVRQGGGGTNENDGQSHAIGENAGSSTADACCPALLGQKQAIGMPMSGAGGEREGSLPDARGTCWRAEGQS